MKELLEGPICRTVTDIRLIRLTSKAQCVLARAWDVIARHVTDVDEVSLMSSEVPFNATQVQKHVLSLRQSGKTSSLSSDRDSDAAGCCWALTVKFLPRTKREATEGQDLIARRIIAHIFSHLHSSRLSSVSVHLLFYCYYYCYYSNPSIGKQQTSISAPFYSFHRRKHNKTIK